MLKITVEPVLLFYMLSTYMLYPALQDLIYRKVCYDQFSDKICANLYDPSNEKSLNIVQKVSSHWILSSTVALLLPCIISGQFLGSWSDIYSRKLTMLIPPIGGVLGSLLYIGLSVYIQEWPVSVIIIASLVMGLCGGFVSCIITCMSYLTEITTKESRTLRVSILEAMIFVGATCGPLLTGWIINMSMRTTVFVVIMAFHTLTLLYIVIFIRDIPSRFQPDVRRLTNAYSLLHIQNSVITVFKSRPEKGRKYLLLLLVAASIIILCTIGELDISYLFLVDKPLEWTTVEFTHYLAIKNGLSSFSLLFCLPFFKKFPDSILILAGIVSKFTGYLVYAFAKTSSFIYVGAALAFLSSWSVPVIRAAMSKFVEPHEQGKMYACVGMTESIVGIIGTFLFNSMYPQTRLWFKGFVFLFEAMLLVIPFTITCYLHSALKNVNSYETFVDEEDRNDQHEVQCSSPEPDSPRRLENASEDSSFSPD